MRGKGEKNPIAYSNRPFTDDRTSEEIESYNIALKKANDDFINSEEYDWLFEHLPEIAPKSLSGYVRMKNSKSNNFMKLVEKAKESGYEIKC